MYDLINKIKEIESFGLKYIEYRSKAFTVMCKNGHVFRNNILHLRTTKGKCEECETMDATIEKNLKIDPEFNYRRYLFIKNIVFFGHRFISFNGQYVWFECKNGHVLKRKRDKHLLFDMTCKECINEENEDNNIEKQ